MLAHRLLDALSETDRFFGLSLSSGSVRGITSILFLEEHISQVSEGHLFVSQIGVEFDDVERH